MSATDAPVVPAGASTAGVTAPALGGLRLVAIGGHALLAGAWWLRIGIPTDPVTMFFLLWLAAIAWRWGLPWRRHLDFARDWWPALATLLFYIYTRGLADDLGLAPHVRLPVTVDRWLGFGELPTQRLQQLLCGSTCTVDGGRWYDTLFTATYTTHFFCGLILATVLWLRDRSEWVRWMRRYLTLNLAGLCVYVLYPMAPPWMASDRGAFTPPIERITGRGGSGPGLRLADLTMGPVANPVAAMPSLHAGTACLVAFFAISVLRWRLRWLMLLYPLMMATAVVYLGEHYLVDTLAGAALAGAVMAGCARWERRSAGAGQGRRRDDPGAGAAYVGGELPVLGHDDDDPAGRLGGHQVADHVVGDHAAGAEEDLDATR